jgi:hypothetical protein
VVLGGGSVQGRCAQVPGGVVACPGELFSPPPFCHGLRLAKQGAVGRSRMVQCLPCSRLLGLPPGAP